MVVLTAASWRARPSRKTSIAPFWTGALVLPIVVVAAAAGQPFVDPRLLFIDPLAAAEIAQSCCGPHLGFMSNLGVLMLAGAATAAGLAGGCRAAPPSARAGAAFAALLSAWIALDDLFLLHERVLPAVGAPEIATQAIYIAGGLVVLLNHGAWMSGREAMLLRVALICFGLSVGLDIALEVAAQVIPADIQASVLTAQSISTTIVMEDGAKFIACWLWSISFIRASHGQLNRTPSHQSCA